MKVTQGVLLPSKSFSKFILMVKYDVLIVFTSGSLHIRFRCMKYKIKNIVVTLYRGLDEHY